MARIDNVQRITPEDYSEDDRDLVERLANNLNYFMTQTVDVVNGRLSYENMNRDVKTIEITVDSTGKPIQTNSFSAENGLRGTIVINSINLTNGAIYPTSMPFISWTPNQNGTYRINNISGLQANNKYRLVFEVIY